MSRQRLTVQQHCDEHTLLIPDQLSSFADSHLFMTDKESSVYFKDLERDLRGVEFFTSQPCLTYILDGHETFTSFDNQDMQIKECEMLLMPQSMYLVSDFKSGTGPLRSFLFFFGVDVLEEYLVNTKADEISNISVDGPLLLPRSPAIDQFMEALRRVYKPSPRISPLVRIKLLELLYLLHERDDTGALRATLAKTHNHSTKRNIARLMSEHFLRDLTVQDYAELSGRSLSTFSREFRRIYNMSPKQWLIDARLRHARALVTNTNISITEIAYTVGYENVSHFIKTFKDHFDETPKQLRQSAVEGASASV